MPYPKDAAGRKGLPIFSGLIRFFPNACAAVAELSNLATQQHHPGEPLHWDLAKSADETDARERHIVDEARAELGQIPWHDTDGAHHAVKTAWRSLARLERLHNTGHDIFAIDPREAATQSEQVTNDDDSQT